MITAAQIPNDTVTGYAGGADALFESARQLYENAGTGTSLPVPLMLGVDPIINNYFYIGAVLLLFAAFCYMIYYYKQEIALLFSDGSKDKMLSEQSLVFKRFLTYGVGLSLLLYAMIAIKTADIIGVWDALMYTGEWWVLAVMIPVSALILALYAGYRKAVNALIAKVTSNDSLFSQYDQLTRIFLMTGALVLIPLFFLLVFTENPDNKLFIWIVLGLSVIIYIFYLSRSLRFFRQKNVSVFHWFLYLCAVEFLPLSYVLVITGRLS